MNEHEKRAWRTLVRLGAAPVDLGMKRGLDLAAVRIRSRRDARSFVDAVVSVVGRSGANRRHVDRSGLAIFVVTDDRELP